MRDRPDALELLEAVNEFLAGEVLPLMDDHRMKFRTLVAINALAIASRAVAQTDRLTVALGQWGTETSLPWRNTQAEKPLWDHVFDPLIQRDFKTFAGRPGLASEWKPSSEMRTWTFKLRPGVMFHENYG